MGNSSETEFNVEVTTSMIKLENQFYNNNREALVELDSKNITDGLNNVNTYLETNNLSKDVYNIIVHNFSENKIKIYEGDNNNHIVNDHDFIDTYIVSKYLDNVMYTKQSIVIKPNQNVNIDFKD